MSASSHALLRIGEHEDIYYSDPQNTKIQAIPVEYNTRFQQDLANKGQGTSVFLIPPGNGLRHIVIVLGYNAVGGQNNALNRGWGYNAIKNISFRIAGSSQYYLSGAQLLARNMRLCRTKSQRDSILQLGGAEVKTAAEFAAAPQYAYIPVSVFAAPSSDGIGLPLPLDASSQQVQITVELNPPTSFWVPNLVAPAALPTQFDVAYFQVEQLTMEDKGMSIANRVDLNTHSYNMPLPDFDQQEFALPLQNSATSQPVVLSGFRAGQVKRLMCWLTKGSDAVVNSNKWYKPKAVTALYAGVIYSQYNDGSSAIWNLLDGTSPAAVEYSTLAQAGGGGFTSTATLNEWAELPFAQPTDGRDYTGEMLVNGKEITNGIVNLQITTPTAAADWTLHVVYVYNCTASFSKGSCDLVF